MTPNALTILRNSVDHFHVHVHIHVLCFLGVFEILKSVFEGAPRGAHSKLFKLAAV